MCETGAWRNFEEIEEELTLDELFILYETTSERQQRLMKTVAAAMGASPSDDSEKHEYVSGEIAAGETTLFGYQQKQGGDAGG